jgi:hypothetical protein
MRRCLKHKTFLGRSNSSHEKRILPLSCPSVCIYQHGGNQTDFLENWYWGLSVKIRREKSNLVKISQKYRATYMKTKVRFIVSGDLKLCHKRALFERNGISLTE